MKKRDILLILGIAALALVLLLFGLSQRSALPSPTVAVTEAPAAVTETPGAESGGAAEEKSPVEAFFEEYPAESYLLLTTASGTRMPIPLNEDNAFRITQADGSENVVHIGKDSFFMESSNCENQNCVRQGEVTLENRETRILFNMVICLPHNIRLELVTREEAQRFLDEIYTPEESSDTAGG